MPVCTLRNSNRPSLVVAGSSYRYSKNSRRQRSCSFCCKHTGQGKVLTRDRRRCMQLLNQTLRCLLNKAQRLLGSMQKTVQAEGTGVVHELPGWVGEQSSKADSQISPKAQQPWVKLQEQSLTRFKKPKTVHKQVVCQSKQTWRPNGMLRAAVNVQGSTDIYKLKSFLCLTAGGAYMSAVHSGWRPPVPHQHFGHTCLCCALLLHMAEHHQTGLQRGKQGRNIFASHGHCPGFCASKLLCSFACVVLTLLLSGHPQ